jgi:hypothetical protein
MIAAALLVNATLKAPKIRQIFKALAYSGQNLPKHNYLNSQGRGALLESDCREYWPVSWHSTW